MDKPLLRSNPSEPRAGNKGKDQYLAHVLPQRGLLLHTGWRAALQWANRLEMGSTHLAALSPKGELDLGFVKCFSVILRWFFSGNQPHVCRHYCYKHWLCSISARMNHWQLRPHIEEGVFSAGSFERAAAMLATVTYTAASPELIMAF